MNKTLRFLLIGAASIIVILVFFFGGMYLALTLIQRMIWNGNTSNIPFARVPDPSTPLYAPGGITGPGMMGGMMGGFGNGIPTPAKPLSIDEARSVVEAYLERLGNRNLGIKEVMIFDNNGYAVVVEKSTGTGAFELLIDPSTKAVFPEYGPNMMWNLKYGMMGGWGHGMMGGAFAPALSTPDTSRLMPISPEKARQIAQTFLDSTLPGAQVTDEITQFYGYYTLDFARDGKIAGMLSVNGYTGQVFLHTWHGKFIEMSEED